MDEAIGKALRRADRSAGTPSLRAPAEVAESVLRAAAGADRAGRAAGALRYRRYAVPAGLAAAVLIAAGLFHLSNVPAVSAAEQLKEAAERSAAFRGWVRYEHGTLGADGKVVPRWAVRLNTVDGTCGSEDLGPERSRAYAQLPGRGVAIDYYRETNTAHVHELNPWDDHAAWTSRQYSLDGMLQEMQKGTEGPIAVSVGRDGGEDKYTLDVPAGRDAPAFRCAVWVDSRTKLVRRVQRNGPHRESSVVVAMTMSYDVAPVRDIHDVGVPADAKVVDERPQGEVKDVLDRIDRRVIDGFGDHAAVLTAERDGPAPGGGWETVRLYGRAGAKSVMYDYRVAGQPWDAPQPAGWPTPTVAAALRAVGRARPASFYVFDDSRPSAPAGWVGNYDPQERAYRGYVGNVRGRVELAPVHLADRWRVQLRETAAYRAWPGRAEMRLFFMGGGGRRGVRYALRRDENRPGLVGLLVTLPADKDGVDRGRGFALWMDPARDDVPVEFVERSGETGDRAVTEYRTRYLAHAQTAGDRWYPTEWVTRTTDFDAAGKVVGAGRGDRFWLRVETETALPADWYQNPLPRVMALPAERTGERQASILR